jgi:uncharacterized protein YqeY
MYFRFQHVILAAPLNVDMAMTSLLARIKADALTARKSRDAIASSLLITLGSEASMTGVNDGKRESTDAEVLATVRKFLKGNTELLAVRGDDEVALREKTILEGYLPKQMTEDELRAAITVITQELGITTITGKDTGAIMKALTVKHAGQYAGAQASALVKSLSA